MREDGGLKTRGVAKRSIEGKPLVSIVTPVFNGRMYLEQTIQSVIGQTYDNVEYIVVDGGSTDGSIEIIRKYEKKIDYWLTESDSGMYEAINKGLESASGDILAYINCDDLYYPDSVKMAVEYFKTHLSTELIYGNCDFIGAKGNFLYTYRYPKFRFEHFISLNVSSIPQQATFWRKDTHEKIGYFDTTFKLCGDFDFYAKAGKNCRIDHLNAALARYRLHGKSLTALQGHRNREEVNMIHIKYDNRNRVWRMIHRWKFTLQLKLLNMQGTLKRAYLRARKGAA